MRRREFLNLCGCGLAAAAMPGALRATAPTKRPNIILFLVDDMGWQDTSVPFWHRDGKPVKTALNRRYRTPHMEAMAREGMLFADAYACAICSPTRCSLLSGMNAARHRVTDWTRAVDSEERLRSSGEGCLPPLWSANGLQPQGTGPAGRCLPPWKRRRRADGGPGEFYRPTDPAEAVPYAMKYPFTDALAFPELLRRAGYHTIHCGKAHWGSGNFDTVHGRGATTPGADPRGFGFDVNIGGFEVGGPANYRGDRQYGNRNDRWVDSGIPGLDRGGYYEDNVFLTDALTREAIAALKRHREADPGQPFFLYMAHYAIHAPWGNNEAYDARRAPAWGNPGDGLPWNDIERNYATLIQGMDDSLGALRAYLAEAGLAEDTLILFIGDNGGNDGSANQRMQESNAPLRAGKGSCYEGGTREPMLALWPGHIEPGSVSHEPILIEDFYPTLLEVAGVPLPGAAELAVTPAGVHADGPLKQVIDGESFLPVLTGLRATVRPDGAERPLLWHYPNRWGEGGRTPRYYNFYSALRLGDWKLIYNHNTVGGAKTFELYNLAEDIGESHDLAATRPEITDRLRKLMGHLLRERGAQMPLRGGQPVPYPDAF